MCAVSIMHFSTAYRAVMLLSPLVYTRKQDNYPELKTEEGYSADIVRTYIRPGDICPHYVRTTSHEGYMSHEGDVVRT